MPRCRHDELARHHFRLLTPLLRHMPLMMRRAIYAYAIIRYAMFAALFLLRHDMSTFSTARATLMPLTPFLPIRHADAAAAMLYLRCYAIAAMPLFSLPCR